jgi:hypothetical protein
MSHDVPAPYIPKRFWQDPDEVKDYSWDWQPWLTYRTDTIASYVIAAAEGITVESSAVVGGVVSAFLSGGVAKNSYTVSCTVVTTGGRTLTRSIVLMIREL